MTTSNTSDHAADALRAVLGTFNAQSSSGADGLFERNFDGSESPVQRKPFVTISRQAGAGARQLAEQLAECLNRLEKADVPWTSWDRELVEKVASDHHLSSDLIDSLTEHNRSWVNQFLTDVWSSFDRNSPDDFRIYRRVAKTIRALAQHGRVIIVGRGGMCVTRDMPDALHVRLVAPFAHRVKEMAKRNSLSLKEARRTVQAIDRGREAFYRHYYPDIHFLPDQFSVTFNTCALSEQQILDALVAMLTSASPAIQTAPRTAGASEKM